MARYVIGIDLGTSNSALCYVDTLSEVPEPRLMPIPQRAIDVNPSLAGQQNPNW